MGMGVVPAPSRVRYKKSMSMAMFKRKFARTIPDNLRAPHIKMWGFEAKRARKFTRTSPRTLPFFFHYHAFFFPERVTSQNTSLKTQGKQAFEGGNELFDPHPYMEDPQPTQESPGPKGCTRWRVPPVALHLSRYTCRS